VQDRLKEILKGYACGKIPMDEALRSLMRQGCRPVGDVAKLDIGREARVGIPEAILAEGKDEDDLVKISLAHLEETGSVIVTRVSPSHLQAFNDASLPKGAVIDYNPRARTIVLRLGNRRQRLGRVGVLAAGTADIPAAEEARVVAEEMGCDVYAEYDVGVAGIHRLFPCLERMRDADAFVVAAGREGTLPAVVAGLVDAPVIGLPVSTGYGLGGQGVAALMSMLQSCTVLAVVNIDAGFIAGAYAAMIASRSSRADMKKQL
jgi:NCAIR mutase (PurE)-related protein